MGPKTNKKRRSQAATESTAEETSADLGTPIQLGDDKASEHELLSLHRARFVDWEPTAVTASAASGDGSILAVARESGAVELWESDHWTCLTTLVGPKESAVTSLAWLQDAATHSWHLFSAGLDGSLTEWNVLGRKPKRRTDALGGAVWAVAAQPPTAEGVSSRLAVACDDGCLRLFGIEDSEQGLVYESSFPPLAGRLLSTAWHPKGKIVVTGTSDGSLHAWEVSTKRELLRLHTGDERKQRQDVWAVAVLHDGTLVTGDSGGNVQFWDAAHGSLVSGYRIHIAAVLALAAAPDGLRVFASGVDSQVAVFQKIEADDAQPMRWEYLTSKRPHTHDVRTMAVVHQPHKPPLMVSGGNDAQLFAYQISRFTQEHPFRLTKAPEAPRIEAATDRRAPPLLLCTQRESCDIWQLGTLASHERQQKNNGRKEGQQVNVDELPAHVARLTAAETILAAAISPEGGVVALADDSAVHLYSLEADEGAHGLQLEKVWSVPKTPGNLSSAASVAFTRQGRLLIADAGGNVTIFDAGSKTKVGEISLPLRKTQNSRLASCTALQTTISLSVSSNGKFAALLKPFELHMLDLEELSHRATVPSQEGHGPTTAAAFSASGDTVAVATADNNVALYDTASSRLVDLGDAFAAALASRLSAMPGTITGISFLPDPQRKAAFLTTPGGICFVDFKAPLEPRLSNKRRKAGRRGKHQGSAEGTGTNGRVIKLANICLSCKFVAADAAVMVEKDWMSVADNFPPPVYRHRYGT